MTEHYQALFSPFELAGKKLKNRIVHASMTTRMGKHSALTEPMMQYYANRAAGGAAMIVSEPLSMARHQNSPFKVIVFDNRYQEDLKRWAEAVESHDCRFLGQIQDPGRGRHEAGRNPEALGASALPDDLSGTVPRALTAFEIESMIEEFSVSALRLKTCGFSGVEISAGHGHLFHQFLSPWSNIREDAYGGDVVGRSRFLSHMLAAIRSQCGHDFIVGLKLPGDDGVPGGINAEEAIKIANHLCSQHRIDYLTFAQGSHARSLEMHIPDDHEPRVTYLPLFNQIRAQVNPIIPLMILGRITDPAEADKLIAQNEAQLVGLGRALVTDPAWPLKARQGRAHNIRYCVSCNNCWFVGVTAHQSLSCDNNPRVALVDETDYWPRPAPIPKKVVIVGAGIAGMEAAWVAAARGHEVHLFSRSSHIGGKARLRSQLPGGESISSIYDYQMAASQRAGVVFHLQQEATAEDIIRLQPHEVILATGSTMVPPRWLPKEAQGLVQDLRSAILEVIQHPQPQSGSAVLYDMDQSEGTYAAAMALKRKFQRVVVVTPRNAIAEDTAMVTHQAIHRRFSRLGIEVMTLSEPCWTEEIENGRLEVVQVYTGFKQRIDDLAFFSYSTPRAPNQALWKALEAKGFSVHLIGDCLSPRTSMKATQEGHSVGHAL